MSFQSLNMMYWTPTLSTTVIETVWTDRLNRRHVTGTASRVPTRHRSPRIRFVAFTSDKSIAHSNVWLLSPTVPMQLISVCVRIWQMTSHGLFGQLRAFNAIHPFVKVLSDDCWPMAELTTDDSLVLEPIVDQTVTNSQTNSTSDSITDLLKPEPIRVKTSTLLILCFVAVLISAAGIALLMYVLDRERKQFIELKNKHLVSEGQPQEKIKTSTKVVKKNPNKHHNKSSSKLTTKDKVKNGVKDKEIGKERPKMSKKQSNRVTNTNTKKESNKNARKVWLNIEEVALKAPNQPIVLHRILNIKYLSLFNKMNLLFLAN